jgi:transcriptional regulator with XRE-family HTH domain
MRSHRGIASATLSNKVIEYLVGRGYAQADVARMIGLSEGFVSLVRSRERSFTVDHLIAIADRLNVPLGAFLLAANPAASNSPDARAFAEATERISRQADEVIAAIKRAKAGGVDRPVRPQVSPPPGAS